MVITHPCPPHHQHSPRQPLICFTCAGFTYLTQMESHTVSALFCLVSFTPHNIFRVHPYCCNISTSYLFMGKNIPFIGIPYFIYLFFSWSTLGLFLPFGINSAAMNISVDIIFTSRGYMPRCGIAESYANSTFKLLKNY